MRMLMNMMTTTDVMRRRMAIIMMEMEMVMDMSMIIDMMRKSMMVTTM